MDQQQKQQHQQKSWNELTPQEQAKFTSQSDYESKVASGSLGKVGRDIENESTSDIPNSSSGGTQKGSLDR